MIKIVDKIVALDLLKGNTDTIILGLLLKKDCYGYEIIKTIAELTSGKYELKEATMYSSVKRLEAEGNITWYWGDETQGGRRKYYQITDKGREQYLVNINNWEFTKKIMDLLILGGN